MLREYDDFNAEYDKEFEQDSCIPIGRTKMNNHGTFTEFEMQLRKIFVDSIGCQSSGYAGRYWEQEFKEEIWEIMLRTNRDSYALGKQNGGLDEIKTNILKPNKGETP